MISIIGLILNFAGAVIMAIPTMESIFSRIHRFPPLSKITKVENRLYKGEPVQETETGFDHLSKAVMDTPQPYYSTEVDGLFKDYSAEFETQGIEFNMEYTDFTPHKIAKTDGDTLDTHEYNLLLRPKEPEKLKGSYPHTEENEVPLLQTTIPDGRLPDVIINYKKELTVRYGLYLLALGFLLQLVSHIPFGSISTLMLQST
ncbi:hypothetical protein [Halovivax asiaticus]|uniref:hypothetical protein n=1 Tax=Halovivax asiaticus TaxID=332953 RepID=UPI00126742A7|nr:hypothetical protein [Halovivax asiaticus]